MSAEKSLAIVVRVVDFSETSCVVTLFTRELGKITGLAKGARRPKGPFESALDLLSLVRVVFLHKSSEALDLLTEAKLERRFRAAARDLSRLYAGYYVAELLRELTDEDDPHPELFDEANEVLADLDGMGDPALNVLRIETAALQSLGHWPMLDTCVSCGNEIHSARRIPFGHLAGGVLCGACRAGQRSVVSLSEPAWRALRTMAVTRGGAWPALEIAPAVRGELRGLMNNYVAHWLGHRPLMQPLMGTITRHSGSHSRPGVTPNTEG